MTQEELKEFLAERESEALVFEEPDYASAFLGLSHDDRAVYSYSKMVKHLTENDEMSEEDATEFIDYNTIRAIPYAGEHAPIVVYDNTEF